MILTCKVVERDYVIVAMDIALKGLFWYLGTRSHHIGPDDSRVLIMLAGTDDHIVRDDRAIERGPAAHRYVVPNDRVGDLGVVGDGG